jgi:hypothetical protein
VSDLRAQTHAAACAAVRGGAPLDSLLTRGDQRRLVREARDWYLDTYAGNVTRLGTCVVATAGPPGAGKSAILPTAVPDLSSRLVIDPDTVKDYLARWCTEHPGSYADLLPTALPDGGTLRPLDLSPLLQTVSTEVTNAVRRDALAQRMDIVLEATMASPAYGERLLLSLAKADYQALVIVSVETDQRTAHARAVERWWTGRQADPELGGRLVLPETIDAAYPGTGSVSVCRTSARNLAETIRADGSAIERVTIAEYDDGALARLDADPPRALDA